ncbi:MAG: AAA family ATPase [Lachnospiraceae bacterium]|nr:AAA family ATPase [Lachnospiraceae bacterium]
MEAWQKLPIGIEDFEKLRKNNFYYIDKTGLIKELLNNWGEVNLFTRPRRFGKSLNMSMLKCFFEIGQDKTIFEGLEISRESALCEQYMGKFPVISISLKGVSGRNFQAAKSMLASIIGWEVMRFEFLRTGDKLSDSEKEAYDQLRALSRLANEGMEIPDSLITESLRMLSKLLQRYYEQRVIILIDEYDVPLDKAYQFGYYDEMVELIRNLFSQAMKTNDCLQFAVLTGCLRVSKESIFTGLNNPKIYSITSVTFNEYFGFTDEEVKALLLHYGLQSHYGTIREWYDGYRFGSADIYSPWDVLNFVDALCADSDAAPQAYWINTSSNDIVRKFVWKAKTSSARREIEKLIAGETIRKEIHQEMTYRDLDSTIENLWSVLFTTGYLTQAGKTEGDVFHLRIPNLGIRKIFVRQIYEWFQETAEADGSTLNAFCEAFENGNAAGIETQFNDYLWNTFIIRDTFVKGKKENFYHGILLGLLRYKESWAVSSNRESGEGYSDIVIEIGRERIGIIIEVKYSDDGKLDKACAEALEQIEKNDYEQVLRENGMKTILKYGIACHKKQCKVVKRTT